MPVFELGNPIDSRSSTNVEQNTWVDPWRRELDDMYTSMRKFDVMDIAEVLLSLSAFSARAAEMRAQLVRVDSRRANAFRTKEVEPLLEEVDRQFKIHSRLMTVRQHDWEMSGKGQV